MSKNRYYRRCARADYLSKKCDIEEERESLMVSKMIRLIRFYQRYISPMKQPSCRFFPTCSEYAIQALQKYGFCRGIGKFVIRILKCHPFHPGGYDPV